MSLAKITLYGMYKWMQDHNDDLFDNLDLPTGMDASILIGRILFKGAEFGVVYGDPGFMQGMIGVWSDTHYSTFERWVRVMSQEYDPLENYNRHEEWSDAATDSRTGKETRSGAQTKTGEESRTGTDSRTESDARAANTLTSESGSNSSDTSVRSATNGQENSTTENTVSAYDASAYQPADKSAVAGFKQDTAATDTDTSSSSSVSTQADETERTEHTGSGSTSDSSTSSEAARSEEAAATEETGNRQAVHSGHLFGNIGVTTSQQMVLEEVNVARFNIYDEAADMFLNEFCIYVY